VGETDGALVNKEEEVNKKFDSIAKAYNDLAQLGSKATDRPRVIIGMPFKATGMFRGRKLYGPVPERCGRGYKWADSKGTGSLALNFEAVAPERCKPIIG